MHPIVRISVDWEDRIQWWSTCPSTCLSQSVTPNVPTSYFCQNSVEHMRWTLSLLCLSVKINHQSMKYNDSSLFPLASLSSNTLNHQRSDFCWKSWWSDLICLTVWFCSCFNVSSLLIFVVSWYFLFEKLKTGKIKMKCKY